MSMPNKHRNAEHTNRPGSFTHNLASVIPACHGSDICDAPDAELDMFSRWIKLSDELLAAGRKARKKAANFRRRQETHPSTALRAGSAAQNAKRAVHPVGCEFFKRTIAGAVVPI
jgi:hypothetical protein